MNLPKSLLIQFTSVSRRMCTNARSKYHKKYKKRTPLAGLFCSLLDIIRHQCQGFFSILLFILYNEGGARGQETLHRVSK